jgi:hypothetical protein
MTAAATPMMGSVTNQTTAQEGPTVPTAITAAEDHLVAQRPYTTPLRLHFCRILQVRQIHLHVRVHVPEVACDKIKYFEAESMPSEMQVVC